MGACCIKMIFPDGYCDVGPEALVGKVVTEVNIACNGIRQSEVNKAQEQGRQQASCLELKLSPPVREKREWISIEPVERKNARQDYAASHGHLSAFISLAELGALRESLPLTIKSIGSSPSPLALRLELAREQGPPEAMSLELSGEYREGARDVHHAVTGTEWQIREAMDPNVSAKYRSPPGGYPD